MNYLPRDRLLLAYSRSSDIGVWHEGREREKNKEEKRKRERGGNSLALTPTPPPPPRFIVFAHISLRCRHDLDAWNRLEKCPLKDKEIG